MTDIATLKSHPAGSNPTPPMYIMRTSQAFDWKGIVVEELLTSGGDDTLPAQSQHMICLYLGEPGWLEQERDNQVYQGVVSQGNAQIVPAGKPSRWKAAGPAYHMHLLIQPDF